MADTLASELSAGRRARLHAAVARALAELRAGDIRAHLAELAHHALEGAAAGTAEEALEWSVQAARDAARRLAIEDAVSWWTRALAVVDLARPGDRPARLDLLVELARAHSDADALEASYRALVAAIDLAIDLGDVEAVGRAAAMADVEGLWVAGEVAVADVDIVAALERALAVMAPGPSVARVRALGALVENAYFERPVPELDRISAEAVEMARGLGDRTVVARALHKRNQALWRPSALAARAEAAEDLLAMAEEGGLGTDLEAVARFGAASVCWERGDVLAAEAHVRAARAGAARVGSPALITQLGFFAATIDTFFGRLASAEAKVVEADELYRRTRRWAADAFRAAFLCFIWMEADRVDDVVGIGPTLLDSPYGPVFRETYAFSLLELGLADEAAALVAHDLPPLLDTWIDPAVVAASTHLRTALGDRRAVAALREHLRPLAGTLACAGTGGAFGDIHLALAVAAHHLGDDDEARTHADASVALLERSGPSPWLARSLARRAELRGDAADHDRAVAIATDLDLPLLRRIL